MLKQIIFSKYERKATQNLTHSFASQVPFLQW